MTTVIAVYNSNGCVGRCDDHCQSAHDSKCTCVCGGANHGKGTQQAIANTTAMYAPWLEAYAKQHPFTEVEVPALYICKTRTAVKIARIINARAGYNKVVDVRRVKTGKRSVWEVDMQPLRDVKVTYQYLNLTMVQQDIGQIVMQTAPNADWVGPRYPSPAEVDEAFDKAAIDGTLTTVDQLRDWMLSK